MSNKTNKRWLKLKSVVDEWVSEEDPTLLVVYLPKSTRADPKPQLKVIGSPRVTNVVTEDFAETFVKSAYDGRSIPAKSIPEALPPLDRYVKSANVTVKRHLVSSVTQQYMKKKKLMLRGYWGKNALKPEFWPASIDFRPPSSNRATDQHILNTDELTAVLEGYISWKEKSMGEEKEEQEHVNLLNEHSYFIATPLEEPAPSTCVDEPTSISSPASDQSIAPACPRRWKIQETRESRGSRQALQSVVPYNGLTNYHNNCWLNATLQALKVCSSFQINMNDTADKPAIIAIVELLNRLKETPEDTNIYSVDNILTLLQEDQDFLEVEEDQQQDPSSFLSCFLLNLATKGLYEPLMLCNNLQCLTCNTGHPGKLEKNPILILDIPGNCSSIQQCVDDFFKSQMLEGANAVMCRQCRQKCPHIISQTVMGQCASSLFIQLRRFDGQTLQKSVQTVDNSRFITLPFNQNYELKAIIVHTGSLVSQGHFITYLVNGTTVVCHDDNIMHIKDETILQSRFLMVNGYLYVYERRVI